MTDHANGANNNLIWVLEAESGYIQEFVSLFAFTKGSGDVLHLSLIVRFGSTPLWRDCRIECEGTVYISCLSPIAETASIS
jgi:hypothetical protein